MLNKLALVILFTVITHNIFSQCSDAGVCVIGRHQLNEFVMKKNMISLGYIYGYSGKEPDFNGNTNDISYGNVKLEADIEIAKMLRVNALIPYSFSSGPLGENNGMGDFALTVSKGFRIKKINLLTFFLGGKFATGKVNSSDSLPQRYMPGLGTNDLIGGAVFTRENYYFGIGYQKPFGRSSNYVTRLKRGDDLFFRAGFFEVFKKVSVKAEILTILQIQRSSVLSNIAPAETFVSVDGSNETQVNLLAQASYFASDGLSFGLFAAIPFLKRNYNFDGLKRTLTITGMIAYNF
ncbi:MAG: hypothetical protein ABI543_07505 [Ignavibacteria bacterium]